jgi:glycosyltransferase involved in cell wall biosynthesis
MSDRVATVCEQDRQLADRHRLAPAGRLKVIHNGVHDLPPELRAQPVSQPVRITMVARFQEPKKHSDLLQALVPLRDLPWTLEFIGDGPLLADVVGLAQRLGFEDRICFSGACPDVPQRLARAQLFVLLSAREGFPRSILEAMRAGLPVIASDVGGVREAIDEGRTGFLISTEDHAALVSRLRLLLTDSSMRAKMGQAGRERFVQNFTFGIMFDRTLKMYEEVLSRNGIEFKCGVPK